MAASPSARQGDDCGARKGDDGCAGARESDARESDARESEGARKSGGRSCVGNPRGHPEPPSPEDEQRRLRKRNLAVHAIKQTLVYEYGRDCEGTPATPDPNDLKLSKRTWERKVMLWRAGLERHLIVSV